MMAGEKFCPLCSSKLELKKINLTISVYFCTDMNCSYPVNSDKCIIVEHGTQKPEKKPKPITNNQTTVKQIKIESVREPIKVANESENQMQTIKQIHSDTKVHISENKESQNGYECNFLDELEQLLAAPQNIVNLEDVNNSNQSVDDDFLMDLLK